VSGGRAPFIINLALRKVELMTLCSGRLASIEGATVSIVQQAGWATEQVRTFRRGENVLLVGAFERRTADRSLCNMLQLLPELGVAQGGYNNNNNNSSKTCNVFRIPYQQYRTALWYCVLA